MSFIKTSRQLSSGRFLFEFKRELYETPNLSFYINGHGYIYF